METTGAIGGTNEDRDSIRKEAVNAVTVKKSAIGLKCRRSLVEIESSGCGHHLESRSRMPTLVLSCYS